MLTSDIYILYIYVIHIMCVNDLLFINKKKKINNNNRNKKEYDNYLYKIKMMNNLNTE